MKDFATWKTAYDAHAGARAGGGLGEGRVTRSLDDPSEVVLMFDISDLAKANEFVASEDLRSAMRAAGVTDNPDLFFVEDAG